jgi:hypothetical protein
VHRSLQVLGLLHTVVETVPAIKHALVDSGINSAHAHVYTCKSECQACRHNVGRKQGELQQQDSCMLVTQIYDAQCAYALLVVVALV